MSYKIKLPEFEGPFDLLLFFIERDEVDIYDIPISSITNDFLAYLKQLEELNIDTASEFILVASTLMRIKSKMLLPRREIDDQGNEIDPRQELVERLLEYRRYKAVLDDLRALEKQRSEQHHRANLVYEIQEIANKVMADAELEELHTVVELMRQGKSPQDACRLAVERIISKHDDLTGLQCGFIAMDVYGRVGSYSVYSGFNYALQKEDGMNVMVDSEFNRNW